ncbi:MAG: D-alanyl-D-alanine carboxypeptidase [Oscillospiraceae bacterium]|nr:D-alanyl-D-alanine carboxypeptidase [Oscillospiraceae bacterium]
MKNLFIFTFAILMLASPLHTQARALGEGLIRSGAAVLMDYETGQILFEKDMHRIVYPASTTKIMTALIAAQSAHPDEIMTVSGRAVDIREPMSSNIALSEGEEITVEDAVFAMMLHSANDASNVLAEHISGSQEDFAAFMTQKAHMIGALNTSFTNAHGLHEAEHYTTAYDIALITRHAAGDERFMRYFGRDRHIIPATNMRDFERILTNYQYMLMDTSRFYDPGVLGGKIGFTNPAGHTMSTIAERDGRILICVVMQSGHTDDKYHDTRSLLDFGFEQFEKVIVERSRFTPFAAGEIRFDAMRDFTVLIHRDYLDEEIILSYSEPTERNAVRISYHASGTPPNVPQFLGVQEIIGTPPPQSHTVMLPIPEDAPPAAEDKIFIAPEILWGAVILFAAVPFFARAAGSFTKPRKSRKPKGAAYAYYPEKRAGGRGGYSPAGAMRRAYNVAAHTENGEAKEAGKARAAVGSARNAPRQRPEPADPQNQGGGSRHNSNGWRHA